MQIMSIEHFECQIFLGAGEHSMAQCYQIYQLLETALSSLNALQQSSDWMEEEEVREDLEADIEDAANQIYLALTGKKITRKGLIMDKKEDGKETAEAMGDLIDYI